MNPKESGGMASSYAAATSSSSPKNNSVGHSSEGYGFGNTPKVDQNMIRFVDGLGTDTPPHDNEMVCDREIVWPPIVIVRYHEKDDNEKDVPLLRRGNLKYPNFKAIMARQSVGPHGLLHHFSGYNAVEARHSFGHRGISLLIFEDSAIGYVEAERLHKHFADQGTDKDAWDHYNLLDVPHQQFYGYMANKEDVDMFNQHCRDERKVKFEMRSHHEMVGIPLDEVNQRLFSLYSRAKGEKDAEKLHETMEENRNVRQEEMSKVIQTQSMNIKELFEAEREHVIQILEGRKTEIKPK